MTIITWPGNRKINFFGGIQMTAANSILYEKIDNKEVQKENLRAFIIDMLKIGVLYAEYWLRSTEERPYTVYNLKLNK